MKYVNATKQRSIFNTVVWVKQLLSERQY